MKEGILLQQAALVSIHGLSTKTYDGTYHEQHKDVWDVALQTGPDTACRSSQNDEMMSPYAEMSTHTPGFNENDTRPCSLYLFENSFESTTFAFYTGSAQPSKLHEK